MAIKHTEDFKQEAVRIAMTSGLSLGSYGRPRMTMELKEAGLDVGDAHPDSGNSTKQACVAQRFPVKLPKGQYIQFVR